MRIPVIKLSTVVADTKIKHRQTLLKRKTVIYTYEGTNRVKENRRKRI